MKIGIVGSMQKSEQMIEVRDELIKLGHQPIVSQYVLSYIGKNDEEKEIQKIHDKKHNDAMREFWHLMQDTEAILVLNLEKNGFQNYIGGNAFLEMGFAHVLNQKIFLYNPIPEIPFYKTEIEAMKPVVINGDLTCII